jgi:hypothetical protein
MIAVGFTVGAPLWGFWSDVTYSRRRALPLLLGTALSALAWLVLLLRGIMNSVSILCGLFFVLGVAFSARTLSFTIAKETFPSQVSGLALASLNLAAFMAAILYPPFAGYLLDSFGPSTQPGVYSPHSFQFVLAFCFAGLLAGVVASLSLWRKLILSLKSLSI